MRTGPAAPRREMDRLERFPRPTAVVFDIGGTLTQLAALPDSLAPWRAYVGVLGLARGRSAELVARLARAEAETGPLCRDAGLSSTLDAVIYSAGLKPDRRGLLAYRSACRPFTAFDDRAVPTLRALAGLGLRMAILSNTLWPGNWHDEILAAGGLLGFFQVRTYSSEIGRAKPHPDAFRHVVERLGERPANTMMVGDRPFEDCHGAAAAGLQPVLVRRPGPSQIRCNALGAEVVDGLDAVVHLIRRRLAGPVSSDAACPSRSDCETS